MEMFQSTKPLRQAYWFLEIVFSAVCVVSWSLSYWEEWKKDVGGDAPKLGQDYKAEKIRVEDWIYTPDHFLVSLVG